MRLTVAPLLCGTACRITLYDVDLALFGVFGRAVCKFSRQTEAVKAAFPAGCFLCFPRRDTGGCLADRFFEDFVYFDGVLFKEKREFFVDKGVDNTAHFAVAELSLGLPFKLRLRHFNRQYGG